MNLFRVGKYSGGLYVLPIFWILYGLLLGTNSFVFADQPVAFSINILWTCTGFTELLAYTMSYEATRDWALWEQKGLWRVQRLTNKRWMPHVEDWIYWIAAMFLLLMLWPEKYNKALQINLLHPKGASLHRASWLRVCFFTPKRV